MSCRCSPMLRSSWPDYFFIGAVWKSDLSHVCTVTKSAPNQPMSLCKLISEFSLHFLYLSRPIIYCICGNEDSLLNGCWLFKERICSFLSRNFSSLRVYPIFAWLCRPVTRARCHKSRLQKMRIKHGGVHICVCLKMLFHAAHIYCISYFEI